eukprot:scaffold30463_cov149-Isochrysis_galbana.AAC.3
MHVRALLAVCTVFRVFVLLILIASCCVLVFGRLCAARARARRAYGHAVVWCVLRGAAAACACVSSCV